MTRIAPLEAAFSPEVEDILTAMMPKDSPFPPLALFRTLGHAPPLARAMQALGSYFLGSRAKVGRALEARDREIVILRVTGRARCAYEWGVHATIFAARVGIDEAQVRSTAAGGPGDTCWADADRALLRLVDALDATADAPDDVWGDAAGRFSAQALLEICVLAAWYRGISYVANAARVPLEPWAAQF
jgi:alkylhydroperoxidase family enzyme